MPKFTPYPEDEDVVDSFDDIEIDEHDPSEDGDDSLVPSTAPSVIKRIFERVKS